MEYRLQGALHRCYTIEETLAEKSVLKSAGSLSKNTSLHCIAIAITCGTLCTLSESYHVISRAICR